MPGVHNAMQLKTRGLRYSGPSVPLVVRL